MRFNWINQLGDWNPQLLREIKGRLKPRNLLISTATSLLGQFFLYRVFQTRLPIAANGILNSEQNRYCTVEVNYGEPTCILDSLGNIGINWQLWWLDLFVWLSFIGVFALLILGTYMLIGDLAHEERRDTLNFLRLSPQPPQGILVGKLLGVPILLYLVVGLAIPLHLWAGLSASIPITLILGFYGLLLASWLFCSSAALLFSLVSHWLGGFQASLGSSAVLIFLSIASFKPLSHIPSDWLNLFSPFLILEHLIAATNLDYSAVDSPVVAHLEWFYLPIGGSLLAAIGLAVINCGLWAYWILQALQRRFSNPGKTAFSKQQSYLLVACLEVTLLGFAATSPKYRLSTELSFNFQQLLAYNLALFLSLIVALTPQRQALQDWARYRREKVSSRKKFWSSSLVQDLIWGERSPAIVAIALNMAIAVSMLILWIVFVLQDIDKLPAFFNMVIGVNLLLICAAIAQLLMFMRTQKQALWICGILASVILLPPAILIVLSLTPDKAPGLWLFTPFAWLSIEQASTSSIFLALLGQWSIFTLCTLRVTRQLQRVGESASKALFAAERGARD